jgi:hypothetical protein
LSPIQLASCSVQLADEDTAVPEGAGMSTPTPEVAALIACAQNGVSRENAVACASVLSLECVLLLAD